jgi:1-acyl-sn-glycerol-3-phosphate acyltransferase
MYIRFILAQTLIIILFTPLFLIPDFLQHILLYHFLIRVFLAAGKIKVVNLSDHPAVFSYPVIYAGNHKCYADPMIVARQLKSKFTFVMASKVMQNFFFKIIGWRIGLISLDTRSPDHLLKSLNKISNFINRRKYSIIFFPEGEYVFGQPVGRLKKGIAKLAMETGAPVLPLAIYGIENHYVFEKRIKNQTAYIRFGTPIYYRDFPDTTAFLEELRKRIETLYYELEEKLKPHF